MLEDADVERLAPRLGERAGARVDPDRIAAGVLARLRSEPVEVRRAPWWRRGVTVRLAAAAMVVLVAGWLGIRALIQPPPPIAEVPTPAVLDELGVTELVDIADSLRLERPIHEFVPATLEDLSLQQLRALLQEMEG
jgi:hypothetical protein